MKTLRNAVLAAAALFAVTATAAHAGNTTFFTSNGDEVFPFTPPTTNGAAPGTISNMTITTPSLGRRLNLSDFRLDSGLASASATGTSTAFGIARTAGTSYDLVGAATSSSAVTTKAIVELTISSTFTAGAVPVTVNVNYTGSGTITAASTTINMAAYTEEGGVEAAITGVTPASAQQITGTATGYVFTIPASAALTPGKHINLEFTMVVTTSAGAATGQINGASISD